MKKLLIFLLLPISVFSQQLEYKFFISFKNKNFSEYKISEPEKFLSFKSLERRKKQNILINQSDLPVSKVYISEVREEGFKVLTRTKWFNGIVVSTTDSSLINNGNFSFVDTVFYFGKWIVGNKEHKKRFSSSRKMDYGASLNQIYMLWGDSLHYYGFRGENVLIAVLDAGFYNVDSLSCFDKLNNEGRV